MAGGRIRQQVTVAVAFVAIAGAVVLGVVAANSGDEPSGDPGPGAADPVDVAEEPPVAEPEEAAPVDMYSRAELTRMWEALAALPAPGVQRIHLHEGWADLTVQTAPGALTYDELEYDGVLGPADPGGQISGEDPAAVFFPLDEVDPAVVAACAARAAEVAQRAGRAVGLIVIARDVSYGDIVTINVHLEADAYGDSPVVTWNATGQYLLDDGIDE